MGCSWWSVMPMKGFTIAHVRNVGLGGVCWQRCRVHFLRNALSLVPKSTQPMVSGVIRTVFAQPDHESAMTQVDRAVETLSSRFPKVATLLSSAAEGLLAHMAFPVEHRRQIHSTSPLGRLNEEIKRRIRVVGIFLNREAALRLVGAVLGEQNDEWLVGKRCLQPGIRPPDPLDCLATHSCQQGVQNSGRRWGDSVRRGGTDWCDELLGKYLPRTP